MDCQGALAADAAGVFFVDGSKKLLPTIQGNGVVSRHLIIERLQ